MLPLFSSTQHCTRLWPSARHQARDEDEQGEKSHFRVPSVNSLFTPKDKRFPLRAACTQGAVHKRCQHFFPDLCTSLSAGASFFVLSFGNFYQFLTPSQLPMSFMDGPQPKHSIQTRQLSYAEQN